MIKFCSAINKESIIDVTGTIQKVEQQINSATIKNYELSVATVHIVNSSTARIPFQIDDASRPES